MRKRQELTDPGSCLNGAEEDEYVFVLLPRDLAFAAALRAWARERVRLGLNAPGDAEVTEALEAASRVEEAQAADARGAQKPARVARRKRKAKAEGGDSPRPAVPEEEREGGAE